VVPFLQKLPVPHASIHSAADYFQGKSCHIPWCGTIGQCDQELRNYEVYKDIAVANIPFYCQEWLAVQCSVNMYSANYLQEFTKKTFFSRFVLICSGGFANAMNVSVCIIGYR